MDPFYKKLEEERKAIELENIKLKLKMVSKSTKLSQPSVDDYIKNILGSGLRLNAPQKKEFKSMDGVHNDSIYKQNNFNQSCNLQTQGHNGFNSHTERSINLPSIYHDVILAVELSSLDLDTQKIYDIFITSGLNQDILGQIWSMINRTSPGKLTRQELIAGLAMIAMCQEQYTKKCHIQVPSWENVISLYDFPIPQINLTKPNIIKESKPLFSHILSESDKSTIPQDNDEWADFSTFHTEEKSVRNIITNESNFVKPQVNNLDSHSTVSTEVSQSDAVIHSAIDLYQEINNQFSNWQDNIQSDKSNICNKIEIKKNTIVSNIEIIDKDNLDNKDPKKQCSSEYTPTTTDNDFGDFQIFSTIRPEHCDQNSSTSNLDRYELFNCEIKGPCDNIIDQWIRCLTQSLHILSTTVSVLKQVDDEMVKIDVFNSDKGILLLKGIIEVYRTTRNIKLSASRSSILTSSKSMLNLLSDLEKYWNEFMLIIPEDMQIDVQSRLSRSSQDILTDKSAEDSSFSNCCGVCLCPLDHDEGFLSHGLHKYHCPCANLWVNTLDLTLPGLVRPESVL